MTDSDTYNAVYAVFAVSNEKPAEQAQCQQQSCTMHVTTD